MGCASSGLERRTRSRSVLKVSGGLFMGKRDRAFHHSDGRSSKEASRSPVAAHPQSCHQELMTGLAPPQTKDRIRELDGLRGIACGLVLLWHLVNRQIGAQGGAWGLIGLGL